MRMRGYKLTRMNLRIRGCKDTSKHTRTYIYEDAGMQAKAHELGDMRMYGYKDKSKYTQT